MSDILLYKAWEGRLCYSATKGKRRSSVAKISVLLTFCVKLKLAAYPENK